MEPLEHSEQLEHLLAGYVLGDLTPKEAARVYQLIESDPDLAAEVRHLQSTLALLPLSLPSAKPPEKLRSQILQAARDTNSAEISKSKFNSWIETHKWKLALTWGSLAAVLLAGLGIETYRLHQKLAIANSENQRLDGELKTARATLNQIGQENLVTSHQELSRYREVVNLLRQPNKRFLNLRGMDSMPSSSGSLVIAPRSDTAILLLQDVPSLPNGKVYRMWAFVDGRKVSCAEFQPNQKGQVFLQLPLDKWGGTTKVVVTIEPDREIDQPTGEKVIIGT